MVARRLALADPLTEYGRDHHQPLVARGPAAGCQRIDHRARYAERDLELALPWIARTAVALAEDHVVERAHLIDDTAQCAPHTVGILEILNAAVDARR